MIKFHPLKAEFFYADRPTDGRAEVTNLVATFRNFANLPKNESGM
jgi:hypothetical protein